MLSIRTDLSSLITQGALSNSTNRLNQAIERMTTGSKINCAKDNAANYSINTNMATKIGAYNVAADNVAMGMDLVTTASDIVSNMQNKAERLRALCIQSRNGTYGAQSLSAINSEANAIISEITRLYTTAEYNGIKFFEGTGENAGVTAVANVRSSSTPQTQANGFIENPVTYTQAEIDAMSSIDDFADGASGTYKIEDANDLSQLATLVNGGANTSSATFVLANNIDLTDWQNANGDWTPIGNSSYCFVGTFDGNGRVIRNLKIESSESGQGLFGYAEGSLKNVGLEDVNVKGYSTVGGLAGYAYSITNCYATGDVTGAEYVGGLAGSAYSITNCYATGDVTGTSNIGGLAGGVYSITNCYATGDVTGAQQYVGGLVGYYNEGRPFSNCYATGDVTGAEYVGGLVGYMYHATISNCYATGDATGTSSIGGLVGFSDSGSNIRYSYATGTSSNSGLVGSGNPFVSDSASVQTDSFCSQMTEAEILSESNLQSMGFTEENGWYIENGYPIIQNVYYAPSTDATSGGSTGNIITGGINLQVGINNNSSCQISFDMNFAFDLSAIEADISSDTALASIDSFIAQLSEQETKYGAIQNRLESALDSIHVSIENLASSLSTIRDADMAEVSSTYIQQQILQEASATLMASSNNIRMQNVLGLLQGL